MQTGPGAESRLAQQVEAASHDFVQDRKSSEEPSRLHRRQASIERSEPRQKEREILAAATQGHKQLKKLQSEDFTVIPAYLRDGTRNKKLNVKRKRDNNILCLET